MRVKKKDPKEMVIGFKAPISLVLEIDRVASSELRTRSNFILKVLTEHLEKLKEGK